MIKQICYVLTSSGADLYAQMTYISASLSRRLYPDAQIVVLVDEVTNANLKKCDSPLLALASRIISVETGIEKEAPRSRFVKTSMRKVIDGDFVFIDADAVPIRRFDEIAETGACMAAAPDLDDLLDMPIFPSFATELLHTCGWAAPLPYYFNSGVIYMADTPAVHEFGEEWHNRWKIMWEQTGDHRDQPAFNSAIDATGVKVRTLPEAFNAALYISPWKARNAKILHYWMNADKGQILGHSLLAHLLDVYQTTGQIDWVAVDRCGERPLSFNTWREILLPLLGPGGRPPRKWLVAFSIWLNAHKGH